MTTTLIDQTAATAVVDWGDSSSWVGAKPPTGIGIALLEGSWPGFDAAAIDPATGVPQVDGYRRVWPNPDFAPPEYEPARFGTIDEWRPKYKPVSGWFLRELRQGWADIAARQAAAGTPFLLPWSSQWATPGGTQVHKDNGFRVKLAGALIPGRTDGKRYPAGHRLESQGLARLENDLVGHAHIARINFLAGRPVARVGDWRSDGLSYATPATTVVTGSQGPKGKGDGLIDDVTMSKFIPQFEARLVLPNVQFDTTNLVERLRAQAVGAGWVEHPKPGQPYASAVNYPAGNHRRMVPSFAGFIFRITDARLEEYLDHLERLEGKNATLRESRRWLVRNLRGWVTDADAPPAGTVPKVRIRVSETGTGGKMFESPGILEPGQRARFAARGVRNVDDGWNLLRDIFLFATLECVAAARYPAP